MLCNTIADFSARSIDLIERGDVILVSVQSTVIDIINAGIRRHCLRLRIEHLRLLDAQKGGLCIVAEVVLLLLLVYSVCIRLADCLEVA